LKDGWTLLLFIYTHCPDVCPTELLDMSTLKKLMLKDKAISTPKVVVITFDPLITIRIAVQKKCNDNNSNSNNDD
jgi:protein SCO1/2